MSVKPTMQTAISLESSRKSGALSTHLVNAVSNAELDMRLNHRCNRDLRSAARMWAWLQLLWNVAWTQIHVYISLNLGGVEKQMHAHGSSSQLPRIK